MSDHRGPFEILQTVTAMQISENDVEVEDALLCRELTSAEVLAMVEPVRAAHLATKLDDDGKSAWKEFKGKFKDQNEFRNAMLSLCEISSQHKLLTLNLFTLPHPANSTTKTQNVVVWKYR